MTIAYIYKYIGDIVTATLTGYSYKSIVRSAFNEMLKPGDKVVLCPPMTAIPVGYRHSCKVSFVQTFWIGIKHPLKSTGNVIGEWSGIGNRDVLASNATMLLKALNHSAQIRVISAMNSVEPVMNFYDLPTGADQYLWGKVEVNLEFYKSPSTLPVYADDEAAEAGGLVAGDWYINTSGDYVML